MDIPVESKPAGHGHADRLPQLAQPDFEAGLHQARNPSEPPDLRRTFATLAYNSSGDLRDIQAQMRMPASIPPDNVYTKPIPQSVRSFVEALDRSIRKRGKRRKTRPKSSRKRG
jgi:site-specific recombinase XerC